MARRNPPHVILLNGVYTFRKRVPTDIARTIKKIWWQESLHTRDWNVAVRAADAVRRKYDKIEARYRRDDGFVGDDPCDQLEANIEELPVGERRKLAAMLLEKGNRLLIEQGLPPRSNPNPSATELADQLIQAQLNAVSTLIPANRAVAEAEKKPEGNTLAEKSANTKERMMVLEKAHEKEEEEKKLSKIIGSLMSYEPNVKDILNTEAVDRISNLRDLFLKESGSTQTRKDLIAYTTANFIDLFGDVRASEVKKADLWTFRDALARVPINKSGAFMALHTIQDRIAFGEGQAEPKFPKRVTIEDRVQIIRSLLNLAAERDFITASPWVKAPTYRNNARTVEKKPTRDFTADELKKFFAILNKDYSGKDEYWFSMVLLYAGLRPEELGQLTPKHIVTAEGVRYLDLSDIKTKTEESKRAVPIHHRLDGFLTYVAGKAAFFNLKKGKTGYLTTNICARLGKLVDKVNTDPTLKTRSLRHNFITACRDAKIPEDIRKNLSGHKTSDIHARYGSRPSLKVLNEELQKVSFPSIE